MQLPKKLFSTNIHLSLVQLFKIVVWGLHMNMQKHFVKGTVITHWEPMAFIVPSLCKFS